MKFPWLSKKELVPLPVSVVEEVKKNDLGIFHSPLDKVLSAFSSVLYLDESQKNLLIDGALLAVTQTEAEKAKQTLQSPDSKREFAQSCWVQFVKSLKFKTSIATKLVTLAPVILQITYELWKLSRGFQTMDPRALCITMIIVGVKAVIEKSSDPFSMLLDAIRNSKQ